ncbi:hypothetical protein BST61_g5721 [Cercospora zeina]
MELDPPDGNAFHIILLRILLTVVTIFLATYFLATISASTGDLIQELLSLLLASRKNDNHSYDSLFDNNHSKQMESLQPRDRRLPIYAAITLSTVHILLFCFSYYLSTGVDDDDDDNEHPSEPAIAIYAKGICVVLLAIEGVAFCLVGSIWLLVKGVLWYAWSVEKCAYNEGWGCPAAWGIGNIDDLVGGIDPRNACCHATKRPGLSLA